MTLSGDEDDKAPIMPFRLTDLPDDMLYVIMSHCNLASLGRLGRVCQRLCYLVKQDCVWITIRQHMTCIGHTDTSRCLNMSGVREQCRVAHNWSRAICNDICIIRHRVRQMPWIQMDSRGLLWISSNNNVNCYEPSTNVIRHARYTKRRRTLRLLTHATLHAGEADVSRFVCKNDVIYTGSSDGSLCSFDLVTGARKTQWRRCHASDIHCIDSIGDVLITGSRDATVKVWRLQRPLSESLLHTMSTGDRVWSLAVSPDCRSFVAGTAAVHQKSPLQLRDLNTTQLIGCLGRHYKHGAGVLDIQFESYSTLLSCGYDTIVRLWDLRLPLTDCAMSWEEPYDSALYCLQSDGTNAFVVGTARHGMVRLWDKRKTTPVQTYYVGRNNSPVFSLAYDASTLYVALDAGIHLLNFA